MKKIKLDLSWLFFIYLFLLFIFCEFSHECNFGDDLWNFQSIFKMYKGGLIYNYNNVLITPLFYVISKFIFRIFGGNFITFKLYSAINILLKYILIFFLFRKFNFSNLFSAFYISLLMLINYNTFFGCTSYNELALIFSIIGILIYLKFYKNNKYHFIQGFLIFLIFFTKQTTGFYYAFGIILFELLEFGFSKVFFKNQFLKIIIFFPCLLLSLVYMFYIGNLNNFIDLCFGGILEFKNNNFGISEDAIPLLSSIIPIIIFSVMILTLNSVDIKIKKNIKFLLCLAFGMTFNIFPIINFYHTHMAFSMYFILFFYIIHTLLISQIFNDNSKLYIFKIICLIIIISLYIRTYFYIDSDLVGFDKSSPFYGSFVSKENFEKIETITNYISEKQNQGIKVVILSYEAAAYNLPLNINNRELDLPFCGNLGYNGIQKTINKISNMKNTEFLIFTNEDDCFWQESMEIREYILENFKKNGELLNYSIYTNE